LLAYNGLRVDEALSRDVEHLGHQLGHRVLRISRKGGRDAMEPLSPPVERTLDSYLAGRTTGPLFLNDSGRRMYEAQAWRLVRRLARTAGLKSAGQLSPHSLRHTFATSLDDAGVPLQDIQDAMGHADPRTTRRYMATHQHLDRHATYAFAAWLRRKPDIAEIGELEVQQADQAERDVAVGAGGGDDHVGPLSGVLAVDHVDHVQRVAGVPDST
jgi:integrase/recombinase XerD